MIFYVLFVVFDGWWWWWNGKFFDWNVSYTHTPRSTQNHTLFVHTLSPFLSIFISAHTRTNNNNKQTHSSPMPSEHGKHTTTTREKKIQSKIFLFIHFSLDTEQKYTYMDFRLWCWWTSVVVVVAACLLNLFAYISLSTHSPKIHLGQTKNRRFTRTCIQFKHLNKYRLCVFFLYVFVLHSFRIKISSLHYIKGKKEQKNQFLAQNRTDEPNEKSRRNPEEEEEEENPIHQI